MSDLWIEIYLDAPDVFNGNFILDAIPFIDFILSGNSKTT
jgi:hypothetical protein